jgi:hypothetical protein
LVGLDERSFHNKHHKLFTLATLYLTIPMYERI